jgi:hypothetical protein
LSGLIAPKHCRNIWGFIKSRTIEQIIQENVLAVIGKLHGDYRYDALQNTNSGAPAIADIGATHRAKHPRDSRTPKQQAGQQLRQCTTGFRRAANHLPIIYLILSALLGII